MLRRTLPGGSNVDGVKRRRASGHSCRSVEGTSGHRIGRRVKPTRDSLPRDIPPRKGSVGERPFQRKVHGRTPKPCRAGTETHDTQVVPGDPNPPWAVRMLKEGEGSMSSPGLGFLSMLHPRQPSLHLRQPSERVTTPRAPKNSATTRETTVTHGPGTPIEGDLIREGRGTSQHGRG